MCAKLVRANKWKSRWFHKRKSIPPAAWGPSRWQRLTARIGRGLSAVRKCLPSVPAWITQPVNRSELRNYGRLSLLRFGFWKSRARYLISRSFSNPYGRAAAATTATVAVFSGLLVAGAVYGALRYGVNARTTAQRSAYQAAVERGDLDSASQVLNTLLAAAPQNQEYRFQQGLLEFSRGNQDAASAAMRSLVTDNHHLSATRWLLANDFDLLAVASWSDEQRSEFEQLAETVISQTDVSVANEGKLLMSKYLLASGVPSDALRYLNELVNDHPTSALTAATICLQQGKVAAARAHAEKAKTFFTNELNSHPNDVAMRLDLARALIVLSQEEQALRELSSGFQLTEDPRLRLASAEAMVIWAARLGRESGETDQTLLNRLQLLHRASQCAPQDARVNAAIIQLVLECKENKSEQVAALRKATAQGIDPESVHFARGTLALLEGRAEEAQTHLSQAAQHGTQLPATLNNMAMAIYHSTDGDLDYALKLADKAVELLPEHPYLHDTRGRVLLKLQRYSEAITSLEKGLSAPELRPEIYSNLAISYRQLGDTSTAREMESLLAKQVD